MPKNSLLFIACITTTLLSTNGRAATPPPAQTAVEYIGESEPLLARARKHVGANRRAYGAAGAALGLASLVDMLRKRRNNKNYFQNEYGNQFLERLANLETRALKALLRGLATAGALGFGGYHALKGTPTPPTLPGRRVERIAVARDVKFREIQDELDEAVSLLPDISFVAPELRETWIDEQKSISDARTAAAPAIERVAQQEQKAREIFERAYDVQDPKELAAQMPNGAARENLERATADIDALDLPQTDEQWAEYNARLETQRQLMHHALPQRNQADLTNALGALENAAGAPQLVALRSLEEQSRARRTWDRMGELTKRDDELAELQTGQKSAVTPEEGATLARAVKTKEREIRELEQQMPEEARAFRALDQYRGFFARVSGVEEVAPDKNAFASVRSIAAQKLATDSARAPHFSTFAKKQSYARPADQEIARLEKERRRIEIEMANAMKARERLAKEAEEAQAGTENAAAVAKEISEKEQTIRQLEKIVDNQRERLNELTAAIRAEHERKAATRPSREA